MWEIFFLLLPLAALSGFLLGKKRTVQVDTTQTNLSPDYYSGLNYLLNEQPDKAVDAFIRMLDISQDTAETTLALGNLFRRKGEVDRAIRIHQNLIAKPTLTAIQRRQALMELGQDYMRSGMYDRAENLFIELAKFKGTDHEQYHLNLIDIYEREKDWSKAINIALKIQENTGRYMGRQIAHYHCEKAEILWAKGALRLALKQLKQSLAIDRTCVRASILGGDLEYSLGQYKTAIRAYKRVQYQDFSFVSEVLSPIKECYDMIGQTHGFESYLEKLIRVGPNLSIILANTKCIEQSKGEGNAAKFLANFMREYPSLKGLGYLVDLHLSIASSQFKDDLIGFRKLLTKLIVKRPSYRCGNCGFFSKKLHWQCPSCRLWSELKPIQGIESD